MDQPANAKPHEYGPPPPGQGSQPVCRRCGIRKSVGGTEAPCPGVDRAAVVETRSDYEPI